MPQGYDEAGNLWEVDAQGNPVRLLQAAQSQQQPPADPSFQYEGPKAAADLNKTQADANRSAATLPYDVRKAAAEATKAEAEAARGPEPSATALDLQAKQQGQMRRANTVRALMSEVRSLYEQDIKGGNAKRLFGLTEYIDALPANERFRTAGRNILPLIRNMIAQSAKEGDSNTELQIFESYIPTNDDTDATIEQKFRSMEILLGGMVDGKTPSEMLGSGEYERALRGEGDYANVLNPQAGGGPSGGAGGSVWEQNTVQTNSPGMQAADMLTGQTAVDVPPEYKAEVNAWFAQNLGKFDPDAYAQFRVGLDRKYGYPDTNAGIYAEDAKTIQTQLENYKGGPIEVNIRPQYRDMSLGESARNLAVNNPVGAAASGFANMMSVGGVEALAGDDYNALRDARPLATTGGEIAGAIVGTGRLGAASRAAARRLAPRTLGGGARAQIARNLATDVAYGTGYGEIAQDDPVNGAIAAGIGSTLGQVLGRGAGRIISGARADPAAQRLLDRGIPLTVAQRIGPTASRIEDRAMSVPVLGDILRNRRMEGMEGFNRAAFEEAGAPIGYTPRQTGEAGLRELYDSNNGGAINRAYNDATAGVNVQLDDQLAQDLRAAMEKGGQLPDDLQARFMLAINNRVRPSLQGEQLSGDNFQQTMRALKDYRSETPRPGFEGDYRAALGDVMDALEGQMRRGGGESVTRGLEQANQAYRSYKTLRDAIEGNIGGTQAGGVGLVTPNQLQRAGVRSTRRFGGERPFRELADAGQEVLPSTVPNSGTADRIAQMALPGALLGSTAAGAGMGDDPVSGGVQGAGTALTLGALLALAASRRGQQVLAPVVTNRPDGMRRIGDFVRRNSGVAGAAALPITLQIGQ